MTLPARTATMGWTAIWQTISDPRVVASYKLSVGAALAAAGVNAVFGLIVAWVLARYRFPGKRIVDAFIDLPFALPTAVAGITLTTLYAPNGWLGAPLERYGIKVAFTPLGITVALCSSACRSSSARCSRSSRTSTSRSKRRPPAWAPAAGTC